MKRLLFLCVALILAQVVFASHGIEHALHADEMACVKCLALSGMQAVPATPSSVFAPAAALAPVVFAVPPAPSLARCLSFRSRAPPMPQSR